MRFSFKDSTSAGVLNLELMRGESAPICPHVDESLIATSIAVSLETIAVAHRDRNGFRM